MPKLVVAGTTHELVDELITIGRAPDNAIHIDDPSVSSRHAELRLEGEHYHLRDVGSTNGTLVNGVPAAEAALRPGDRVRFGRADARYEGDSELAAEPLLSSEDVEAMPADFSARPVDFTNASPFRARRQEKDAVRTAIFIAALVAFAAFLASMFAVFTMRPPAP